MRKKIKGISIMICLCLLLAGCSKSQTNIENLNPGKPSIENESASELFEDDSSRGSMGMFSYGIVAPNEERQVYEYSGKELHIPFKVSGLDKEVSSKFGLLVFVDGISQPYSIEHKNRDASEVSVMHQFSLENEESDEFDIVFNPVTGHKGDRIGVVFATILQPEYKPQNANQPNYGMNHSLSATVFQEIDMKSDAPGQKELHSYSDALVEDISQEIKDHAQNIITDGSSDYLDENVLTELLPQDKEQNNIYTKNGQALFRFRIYGGLEATYRTTFYINNKPIQINGADYIESTTKKGKMSTVEIELDTSAYEELNSIYAISTVTGQDYLSATNSPVKTKSMLLVNK